MTHSKNDTLPIDSVSLRYREGNSDKVYHAAIEARDGGHLVTFAYGRHGSTLKAGVKTPAPVPPDEARKLFDKLVKSKLAKGYRPDGTSNRPYHQTGNEEKDTGVRCQLLNPVEHDEVKRLIVSTKFCLQQKHDGRRLLVQKQGDTITGINRRGLVTAFPEPIREAVARIPCDVIIDGEAVGNALHAFDLLDLDGSSLRMFGYLERFRILMGLVPCGQPALRWIATPLDSDDKLATFEELQAAGAEGVVFKDIDAAFTPGRPNSGGPQLKHKFVENASFVVLRRNAKRSVTLALHDGDTLVPAGKVTIPPNHEIPADGEVVEVRYLYAFRESGSVYQPVYLGPRDDIPAGDCHVRQLKYKTAPRTVTV